MQSLLSMAHALLLCATLIVGYKRDYCPMSLPQKSSGVCYKHRQTGLSHQKNTYQYTTPQVGMPYARLNISARQYMAFVQDKPLLAEHVKLRADMNMAIAKTSAKLTRTAHGKPDEMTYNEYIDMYTFYGSVLEKTLGHQMRLPAKYEPFQDITKFISDQLFAEQRLAGANPLTLQQVTLSNKVGLNWNTLKNTLNPVFDVKKAIGHTLGRDIGCEKELKSVIRDGLLFVLRYPLCDDMVFTEDILDKNPNRTLWPFYSPIALFALVSSKSSEEKLMPVAIQMDYKQDAKVYTPKDGGKWTLAKLNVQVTDIGYSQMVEHLSSTHFVAEAFCVSMERHLSHRHPLYAMLQYHCRGVFTANTLGVPGLLYYMRRLFAYGSKGVIQLITAASHQISWDALDLNRDIKRRGVGKLPYYPYRDDGRKIGKAIREYVHDYVRLYYRSRSDVYMDKELQAFVHDISLEGHGKIRGFPSSIHSTWKLRSILTQFIWLVAARHSAVGYPLTDYVYFIPNSPTKLYTDHRVPAGEYSTLNLPPRRVAQMAEDFTSLLSTMRYDNLFDYGRLLEDASARRVVHRHYCKLYDELDPQLARENEKRYKEGHLTYPYLMPRWLPNGIQT